MKRKGGGIQREKDLYLYMDIIQRDWERYIQGGREIEIQTSFGKRSGINFREYMVFF